MKQNIVKGSDNENLCLYWAIYNCCCDRGRSILSQGLSNPSAAWVSFHRNRGVTGEDGYIHHDVRMYLQHLVDKGDIKGFAWNHRKNVTPHRIIAGTTWLDGEMLVLMGKTLATDDKTSNKGILNAGLVERINISRKRRNHGDGRKYREKTVKAGTQQGLHLMCRAFDRRCSDGKYLKRLDEKSQHGISVRFISDGTAITPWLYDNGNQVSHKFDMFSLVRSLGVIICIYSFALVFNDN